VVRAPVVSGAAPQALQLSQQWANAAVAAGNVLTQALVTTFLVPFQYFPGFLASVIFGLLYNLIYNFIKYRY
jgi:hypothetical protein